MGKPQGVPGAERRRPGRQLVQHRAQRVQVGSLIHWAARPPSGLRCQVRQRACNPGEMGKLRADLRHRHRQREIHQARHTSTGQHYVGRGDVPVQHPPGVHPRHCPGQPRRHVRQLSRRQGFRHSGQGDLAGIGEHHRHRILLRLRQLRHPGHRAQLLQHHRLMPRPGLRVRPQRLLADHRAPGQEQPSDARARTLSDDLGPDRRTAAWRHPLCAHRHLHGRYPLHTLPVGGSGVSVASRRRIT